MIDAILSDMKNEELRAKGYIVGSYGENFTWTIDPGGTMNFIGEGAIPKGGKYNCAKSDFDDDRVRKAVKKLILDERITEIGGEAFKDFTNLTAAVLPDGLKIIGSYAFAACCELTEVNIPPRVEIIRNNAFSGCAINSIIIPESVKEILYNAFWGCRQLREITLPEGVLLGERVFAGSGLEQLCEGDIFYLHDWVLGYKKRPEEDTVLRFKKGAKKIAPYAFGLDNHPTNKELVGVVLDNDISYVGYGAFETCINLESVTADCTFTYISGGCFENTKWACNLPNDKLVYLANAVMGTGTNVKGRSGVLGYEFTGEVVEIDAAHGGREITIIASGAFSGAKLLKEVTIPESIKTIGAAAFSGCVNLEEVDLPHGLKEIFLQAFLACGMKRVYIPPTVEKIGQYAFGYKESEDKSKLFTDEYIVKIADFVILGEKDSAAERYAAENEFEFVEENRR